MTTIPPFYPVSSLTPWFRVGPHSLNIGPPEDVAQQAAARLVAELAAVLQRKSYAVLTPSVGRTMVRIFEVLKQKHRQGIDWQRVVCVQMDEYAAMPASDPRSFAFVLRRDFVTPLGIGRFVHFYDDHGVFITAPKDYELGLRQLGGIDCALHGVGRNGHIGFNEPRQSVRLRGGIVRLSQTTRSANGVPFQHGASLGLGVLREAKSSIVVLLGEEKRDASYQLLFGTGGPETPVTELRNCPQVNIYIDYAAVPGSLSDHPHRPHPPTEHQAKQTGGARAAAFAAD